MKLFSLLQSKQGLEGGTGHNNNHWNVQNRNEILAAQQWYHSQNQPYIHCLLEWDLKNTPWYFSLKRKSRQDNFPGSCFGNTFEMDMFLVLSSREWSRFQWSCTLTRKRSRKQGRGVMKWMCLLMSIIQTNILSEKRPFDLLLSRL